MEQNLTRIFTLFGGLALFLYGMDALSHSLETAAGSRLKSLLAAVTGSPVRCVLAGAVVTAVLQSSSAVTVMVLGFVSAGLLTLRQAVPVIFGCNIGTTVTAQLLAFRHFRRLGRRQQHIFPDETKLHRHRRLQL